MFCPAQCLLFLAGLETMKLLKDAEKSLSLINKRLNSWEGHLESTYLHQVRSSLSPFGPLVTRWRSCSGPSNWPISVSCETLVCWVFLLLHIATNRKWNGPCRSNKKRINSDLPDRRHACFSASWAIFNYGVFIFLSLLFFHAFIRQITIESWWENMRRDRSNAIIHNKSHFAGTLCSFWPRKFVEIWLSSCGCGALLLRKCLKG